MTAAPLEVGASLTALTVMATVSVALSPSPSLAVRDNTELVLSLAALVQVIVAIAVLMLATVPLKTIELSSVPSPVANVRPDVLARVKVPLLVDEIVIESREVSSTSAITAPVMAPAVSSLTVISPAVPDQVGTSFAAETEIVKTYAEALYAVPSCTLKLNVTSSSLLDAGVNLSAVPAVT